MAAPVGSTITEHRPRFAMLLGSTDTLPPSCLARSVAASTSSTNT
jgi:serine/threonine protein kinase